MEKHPFSYLMQSEVSPAELRRMVRNGEGFHLEFKRKANHPDKIAREIVAFANSEGGILLVGVDDDGSVYGSKHVQEDAYVIRHYLMTHCIPSISFRFEKVPLNSRRDVLLLRIPASRRKPHFLRQESARRRKQAFVRVDDKSVTASHEMIQVLRQEHRQRGVTLAFGEHERRLLQYFEDLPRITVAEASRLLDTSRRRASLSLVLMVRAGLLHIHPTGREDYFTLAEEAFQE
jgi:predicted HTH transcriptional regulator